jgi:hypothetical protein
MKIALLSRLPILLGVTTAAALSFAHLASANLITNPGFETGDFTGWTNVGSSVTGTFGGIAPHSGSSQARLGVFAAALSQSVATTPGASYTISFFLALSHNLAPTSFSVSWGGVTIFSQTNPPVGFGYADHTFIVTASNPSTLLLFQANTPGGLGDWLVDDVSVEPAGVTVPDAGSTVSLLGFAWLGLAALRRKLSC